MRPASADPVAHLERDGRRHPHRGIKLVDRIALPPPLFVRGDVQMLLERLFDDFGLGFVDRFIAIEADLHLPIAQLVLF